jgi:GNAT superfamily N-acetyltransferase
MKDTVKMVRVERKNAEQDCIDFLRRSGVCNMYLYEGVGTHHPLFRNYCLRTGDEMIGVLHTKNGTYLHLFLTPGADRAVARGAAQHILRKFPRFEMLFGDEKSVSLYFEGCGRKPTHTVRFIFMEVVHTRFTPRIRHRGEIPSVQAAPLLLPLQIQYEIEEVGAIRSQIDERKVLQVMEKKIRRGEISAIYDGETPVALAGVNARFERCCQIGSVFVLPGYRGKGYGYSIGSYHIGRLFRRYDRIVLFVHEKNEAALHIYETLGFERTDRLIQAYC